MAYMVTQNIDGLFERIKHSQRQAKVVAEAAPNGMLLVNREGEIIFVNTALAKLFGYESYELVGQLVETLVPDRFKDGHPANRNRFFVIAQVPPGNG